MLRIQEGRGLVL